MQHSHFLSHNDECCRLVLPMAHRRCSFSFRQVLCCVTIGSCNVCGIVPLMLKNCWINCIRRFICRAGDGSSCQGFHCRQYLFLPPGLLLTELMLPFLMPQLTGLRCSSSSMFITWHESPCKAEHYAQPVTLSLEFLDCIKNRIVALNVLTSRWPLQHETNQHDTTALKWHVLMAWLWFHPLRANSNSMDKFFFSRIHRARAIRVYVR